MRKKKGTPCDCKIHPETSYPDHRAEINRLKRIAGQIAGVGRMIERGHYCPEILIQTRAIVSAIQSLENAILERHLHHCVRAAFKPGENADAKKKIDELLELFHRR